AEIGPPPVEIGGAHHVQIAPAIDNAIARRDIIAKPQHNAVRNSHRLPVTIGALPPRKAAHPRPDATDRHIDPFMPATVFGEAFAPPDLHAVGERPHRRDTLAHSRTRL